MQLSTPWRVGLAVGIAASLPFVTWIVHIDGGTAGSMVHLFYIPIITAAIFLGDVAGMVTAISAAILSVFVPQSRYYGADQPFRDIFVRLCFFYAVAILAARLSAQFQLRAQELASLLSVSRAINASLRLEDVFQTIVDKAVELMEVKAASIALLAPDRRHLEYKASRGLSEEYLSRPPLHLCEQRLADAVAQRKPTVVRDTSHLPHKDRQCAEREGIKSLACVPVVLRDRPLGGLLVYTAEPTKFRRREIRLLEAFASHAALAIENARLYDDIRDNYWDTVRSLARAIEAKDPYTLGHSERVTEHALRMANQLALPAEQIETIRFGSILHDVGKIGVAEHVLSNSGALSAQDEMLARLHPLIGKSILEPVAFLKPAIDIVLYHHEVLDGSGYPEGLAGDDLPRLARLVAVANAYDVMTSASADRPAMEKAEALEELERLAGTAYDEDMVGALKAVLARDD